MGETSSSKYFIKGFSHWAGEVRRFVAIMATSSMVVDTALHALLKDDRLIQVIGAVEAGIHEEVRRQQDISDEVWQTIADSIDEPWHRLRDDSCHAGLVMACFTLGRFRSAHSLPFSLCIGDVDENLDSLCQQDMPDEETSAKIWTLLHAGFDKDTIKDGLRLLANVSFSSTT
eukprot:272315-Pyramimonas_sp.AAC.1